MSADRIFETLRKLLDEDDRTLPKIAEKSKLPYHHLYRFRMGMRELSLDEAERLYVFFTGKSFVHIKEEG